MSRYRPTADGAIAFVGAEMVLIIERPAATSMLLDVRRWANEHAGEPIQGAFAIWADDLERAIESSRGHDGRSH